MNKSIKVLGTGCPKCSRTIKLIKDVVDELDIQVKVTKVDDIMEIMKYNILNLPAVVVNEEVKIKGRVPSKKELKDLFKTGIAQID